MDMDTTQKELDKQLYLASTALKPDLERVEELLKLIGELDVERLEKTQIPDELQIWL